MVHMCEDQGYDDGSLWIDATNFFCWSMREGTSYHSWISTDDREKEINAPFADQKLKPQRTVLCGLSQNRQVLYRMKGVKVMGKHV